MIKEFNTYLEGIDADFWNRLCIEQGELCLIKKGDEFISVGEVGKNIGLIKSGSFKYIAYTQSGEEKIVGLETVGGFCGSWPFSLHGESSPVAIIANSDSEVYCYSVARIIEEAKQDEKIQRQIDDATEAMFYTIYGRMLDSYTKSPKERYEDLLKKCPKMFEIFSLKDIASYLNITPTHLSRLRKED